MLSKLVLKNVLLLDKVGKQNLRWLLTMSCCVLAKSIEPICTGGSGLFRCEKVFTRSGELQLSFRLEVILHEVILHLYQVLRPAPEVVCLPQSTVSVPHSLDLNVDEDDREASTDDSDLSPSNYLLCLCA